MAFNRKQVTYSSRPTLAARAAHARGDKQFRTYDTSYLTGKTRRRRQRNTIIGVIIAIVLLLLVLFGISSCAGCGRSADLLDSNTTVQITVKEGETAKSVAQSLLDAKLIGRTDDFVKAAEKANALTSIKPGTYSIKGGTSPDDIVAMLVAGPPKNTFTVPEGLTLNETARIVSKAYGDKISAEDFIALATNASAFQDKYPFVADAYNNSLEGFLFPKTYEIRDDATVESVISMMLDQYASETAKLDYAYPKSRGLSTYDVLKLASVVEKESNDQTRAHVASVFYNRLAQNMRLQSDATVAYIVGHDPTPTDIADTNSPYNTYRNAGLPAGPICSPGLSSLQAVCNPDNSEDLYFYFVPKGDGTLEYHFSKTFEEHRAAIEGSGASSSTGE